MSAQHWAEWHSSPSYTLGVEEEVMLLDPHDWSLAQQIDRVVPSLPAELARHVSAEPHKSALELRTCVHQGAAGLGKELLGLRVSLDRQLATLGLRAACSGTHPFAVWHETGLPNGARFELVAASMRELARREPTFGLRVLVGVPDAEDAVQLYNRLRAHLPLLLALSVNSPFWQGRDTGLSSARTPLFQAFPRVGIPRAFESYDEWVETVDLLMRCEAFPDPTSLWWDVGLRPRFGAVEVRVFDVQSTVTETAALAALVQSVARLELEEGFISDRLAATPEAISENRFIAARDGMDARLIDLDLERRVPARQQVGELLESCRPHARDLGCEGELDEVSRLAERTGAERQLELARGDGRLSGLVDDLNDIFSSAGPENLKPETRRRRRFSRPRAVVRSA